MTDFSTEALLAGQGIYYVVKGGQGSGAQPGHPFNGNQYAKDSHESLYHDAMHTNYLGVHNASQHASLAGREKNMAARMQRLADKTTDAGKKSALMHAKNLHLEASKAHTKAAGAMRVVEAEREANESGVASKASVDAAIDASSKAIGASGNAYYAHESASPSPASAPDGYEHYQAQNFG